jgi:hypothetical protein
VFWTHHAVLASIPRANKLRCDVRIGGSLSVFMSGHPVDASEQLHTVSPLEAFAEPNDSFDLSNSVRIAVQDAVGLVAQSGSRLIGSVSWTGLLPSPNPVMKCPSIDRSALRRLSAYGRNDPWRNEAHVLASDPQKVH